MVLSRLWQCCIEAIATRWQHQEQRISDACHKLPRKVLAALFTKVIVVAKESIEGKETVFAIGIGEQHGACVFLDHFVFIIGTFVPGVILIVV